jgi:hypothetical protein
MIHRLNKKNSHLFNLWISISTFSITILVEYTTMPAQTLRAKLRLVVCVGLHFIANAENDDSDASAADLVSSLPKPSEAEHMVQRFVAMWREHRDAEGLFNAYNRFTDTKRSGGEQALGNQEVRQLLKDVGLGNMAIRGELASLLIRVLDVDGDSRIELNELKAAMDVVSCWAGAGESADAGLTSLKRLGAKLQAVLDARSFHAAQDLLESEVYTCAGAVASWWGDGGWFDRLLAAEKSAPPFSSELQLESSDDCASALAERALSHAGRSNGAGHTALRGALKRLGVDSLLVRALGASLMIAVLDADGDERLSASELEGPALNACRVYRRICHDRQTSLVSLARALSLPGSFGGFEPAALLSALHGPTAPGILDAKVLANALQVAASKGMKMSAQQMASIAEAYAQLAPAATLRGTVLKEELRL